MEIKNLNDEDYAFLRKHYCEYCKVKACVGCEFEKERGKE